MSNAISALRAAIPHLDFMFFASIRASGMRGDDPYVELCNGDVLFGFSDWKKTYYAPHFEQHLEAFASLGLSEPAYGAAFDALISYHYENACILLKSLYLRRAGTVLDVGVRGGHWIVKASRIAGCVVGIDASDLADRLVRRHIEVNALTNARFFRAAIGDKDGDSRTFHTGSSGEGLSGFHRETKDAHGQIVISQDAHRESREVTTRSLDSIVAELSLERVDMIVLEINGVEREALRGATEVLRRYRPILYVTNYHDPNGGGDRAAIAVDLEKLGYKSVAVGEACVVYAAD